jgi:hypothetical protein
MDLYLVFEQRTKYEMLRSFLQTELPAFVNKHANVREAMIKYGKVDASTTSEQVERHLDEALKWGTAPKIMVMSRSMFFEGSSDWYGSYDPKKKTIVVHKSLVTQWQKTRGDTILRRSMIVVMLHELVHFLNHEVRADTTIHSEPGHLTDTFHKEAFEAPPLSWERAHHMMYREILRTKGVE